MHSSGSDIVSATLSVFLIGAMIGTFLSALVAESAHGMSDNAPIAIDADEVKRS